MFKKFKNHLILRIVKATKIISLLSLIIFTFFLLSRHFDITHLKRMGSMGLMIHPLFVFSEFHTSKTDLNGHKPTETDILRFILRYSGGISTSQAKKLAKIISEECDNYELDPFLILAVIQVESNFSSGAVSKKGAIGLMQVMPSTAEYLARKLGISVSGGKELRDPFLNVRLGIYYISLLEDRFNNIEHALVAYNYGPNKFASSKKLKKGPHSYVKKVLDFKSLLHDERSLSEPS